MPPKRKFTAEMDRDCQKMYADGISVVKISAIYGVSIACIRDVLYRGGMKRDRPGPPHRLSAEVAEECKKMYEAGISISRIGAMFGVTDTCVRNTLLRSGVKMHQVGEYHNGKRVAVFQDGKWIRYEGSQKAKEDRRRWQKLDRAKNEMRCSVNQAKYRARKKGIPFSLDYREIKVPDRCPVLGIPLVRYAGKTGPSDSTPTLDRIVPSLGYVPENIRIISDKANRIKNNATCEEIALVLADMRRLSGVQCLDMEGDESLWA